MSIQSIIEFLGCEPNQEGIIEPNNLINFEYKGEKLLYQIHVNIEEKTFSISGDFNLPFGYNSVFEVYVEWDRISLETESCFYGDKKFWHC